MKVGEEMNDKRWRVRVSWLRHVEMMKGDGNAGEDD